MRKGEQTRHMVIRKAEPIDLMEATGPEKGRIYRHFDSKQPRLEGSLVVSRLQRKEDACALTCDHLEEHLGNQRSCE